MSATLPLHISDISSTYHHTSAIYYYTLAIFQQHIFTQYHFGEYAIHLCINTRHIFAYAFHEYINYAASITTILSWLMCWRICEWSIHCSCYHSWKNRTVISKIFIDTFQQQRIYWKQCFCCWKEKMNKILSNQWENKSIMENNNVTKSTS